MILIFGSINMDLVMTVRTLPRPGETTITRSYQPKPGGKGANQAVAAARAGAKVTMAGAVGDDGFGASLTANLAGNGVATDLLMHGREPTGIAFICVDAAGENEIVVAAGANWEARQAGIPDDRLQDATLLMQMEVTLPEIWALIARARGKARRIVLNVAPANSIPAETLRQIDVLVVNELEAVAVAASLAPGITAAEAAAEAIARAADLTCIVTLGRDGALAVSRDGRWRVAGMPITPVDTTGAGDAFTGVLVQGLDDGLALPDALRRASVAGALACLSLGAQESLPNAAAIDAALHRIPPARRL